MSDTNEAFERRAQEFFRATGYMAPGKSVAPAMWYDGYEDKRNEAWEKWCARPRIRSSR